MQEPKDSVERINPRYFRSKEKYLLLLRHIFAYEYVSKFLDTSMSVLEIGPGEGYGTTLLSNHVKFIHAVDVDHDIIEYADAKYGSVNCSFEQYDGTRLPLNDESVDAVISFQVIEHVEDDDHFVAEAYRVLKPGGQLVLTTPNRTHRVEPGEEIWNEFHVREYYPEELEEVLSKYFTNVRILGVSGSDEINAIEYKRVRRGFSFRKMIPEPIKKWLDRNVVAGYTTEDFRTIDTNVSSSLDLLGQCTK